MMQGGATSVSGRRGGARHRGGPGEALRVAPRQLALAESFLRSPRWFNVKNSRDRTPSLDRSLHQTVVARSNLATEASTTGGAFV